MTNQCVCAGCLNGTTCLPGNMDTACGNGGAACADCADAGKTCKSGGSCN
jgi:hypothetical protein